MCQLGTGLPSSSTTGPVAQFSLHLHDIEAANALQFPGQETLTQVPETQLNTQAIMQELSFGDSEIQFREYSGAGAAHYT